MEPSFDIRGNLQPYEIIKIDQLHFKQLFVDAFDAGSTRVHLYSNYQHYLAELRKVLNYEFYQLIDGSFTTVKRDPNDIDIVSFIDYRDYEALNSLVMDRFSSAKARAVYQVDAYIVPHYPEIHPKYVIYHSDLLYWRNLFGKTRVLRNKKQYQKGIIQLNFVNNG